MESLVKGYGREKILGYTALDSKLVYVAELQILPLTLLYFE
jgi:hypothetical protein